MTYRFDLPAQSLAESLRTVAQQTSTNILFESATVEGILASSLNGQLTAGEAIQRLLTGTGLSAQRMPDEAVIVQKEGEGTASLKGREEVRVAQVQARDSGGESSDAGEQGGDTVSDELPVGEKGEEEDPERSGIPEILVTGSKLGTLNMDIRRTEDGVQPYVVFDHTAIERSGATNLEEFLLNQLTMVTAGLTNGSSILGNRSSINLRGLGNDETLILVDGRRLAQFFADFGPEQPDINGIPIAAVERIEILPTTASGIYGGSATGGVINIVLRRDYSGMDARLSYGNTVKSDAATRQVDISAGFSTGDGKTSILVAGHYFDASELLNHERSFVEKGRRHILTTDPSMFMTAPTPPLGATPNIRSSTGENLVLDNGVELGAPITYVPKGYPGAAIDAGAALGVNAGQYNLDLADTVQAEGLRQALTAVPETKSLILTVKREITQRIQAFVDVQLSDTHSKYPNVEFLTAEIPGDAPNNPFQQPIQVAVPLVGIDADAFADFESHKTTLGLIAKLAGGWRTSVDFTWNRSRSSRSTPGSVTASTIAAINSGAIDVLADLNLFPPAFEADLAPSTQVLPADAVLKDTALRIAGPLPWSLPGGNPSLSTSLEYRDESFHDRTLVSGVSRFLTPSRDQSVGSAYAEILVPVVSSHNRRAGAELLDVQLAVRRDEYRVTGSNGFINLSNPVPVVRRTNRHASVDPTIGLKYKPALDLTLRASYGTGYRPPSVLELVPAAPLKLPLGFLSDPLRGDERLGNVTVISGGNPDLEPESSESWSAGIILTPRQLRGLRASLDWSRISKSENISTPLIATQRGLNQATALFPQRIKRGEPSGGFNVGPIIELDGTLINIALMKVEALDVAVDYESEVTPISTIEFSLRATRLISADTQATPAADLVDRVGTLASIGGAGGLEWTANSTVSWFYRNWSLGWRTRFFDNYFVNEDHVIDVRQGSSSIPKQIYHDLFSTYRFNSNYSSLLSNLEISFGVLNVFDKEPPLDVVTSSSYYSPLGDPRLANYYLRLRKSFGQ